MPFNRRIEEFKRGTGNLVFSCINGREAFANKLRDRAINANLIDQAGTPLCGPAAFMHCIASRRPNDYVNYLIWLKVASASWANSLSGQVMPASTRPLTTKSTRLIGWHWPACGIIQTNTIPCAAPIPTLQALPWAGHWRAGSRKQAGFSADPTIPADTYLHVH